MAKKKPVFHSCCVLLVGILLLTGCDTQESKSTVLQDNSQQKNKKATQADLCEEIRARKARGEPPPVTLAPGKVDCN